jgi:hypothetical protein
MLGTTSPLNAASAGCHFGRPRSDLRALEQPGHALPECLTEAALARLEMRELFYSFVPVLLAFLHINPTRARFSARKSFVQSYRSVHVGWA